MGVYKSFSYKGKAGSLREGVGLLIQKRAKTSLKSYVKRLTTRVDKIVEDWQRLQRLLMSVKAPKYNPKRINPRNKSLFPRMVDGHLRATILQPKAVAEQLSGGSNVLADYKVKVTGLFGIRSSDNHYETRKSKPSKLSDVGQYLNDKKGKPYAGWKNRAQSNLLQAIKKKVTDG